MRLRYTISALADLDFILEYVDQVSPQGARRIQSRVKTITDLLMTYPHVGLQTEDFSILRITTSPYPYLIFYEVTGDEIIVHAVRHAARNPEGMPGAET